MVLGIVICIVFLILAVLMMTRKLPALLALPIMAVVIGAVAGVPWSIGEENIFSTIIVGGSLRLGSTYVAIIISCWLSQILYRTGVTNTIVKKAAELGGDKPLVISLLLCLVTLFLFTVLFGTGAVAMVGAVVLPILMTVGVPPIVASNVFLAAVSGGYALNPANMTALLGITGIQQSQLTSTAVLLAVGEVIFFSILLIRNFRKNGKKYAFAAPIEKDVKDTELPSLEKGVSGFRGLLACLTPLVVVLLALVMKWNAIVCFFIGIVWAILFTFTGKWSKFMSLITSACYEGFKDGGPAVILFIGIGMVLKAVSASATQASIGPFMAAITPTTVFGMVLFAIILCPLALYRGPFNIFGLGAGLAACMISVGTLPTMLLATIFYACSRWPAQAGPTATQVVWSSSFVGYDPITTTNKIQIPNWIFTALTIVIVAFLNH